MVHVYKRMDCHASMPDTKLASRDSTCSGIYWCGEGEGNRGYTTSGCTLYTCQRGLMAPVTVGCKSLELHVVQPDNTATVIKDTSLMRTLDQVPTS